MVSQEAHRRFRYNVCIYLEFLYAMVYLSSRSLLYVFFFLLFIRLNLPRGLARYNFYLYLLLRWPRWPKTCLLYFFYIIQSVLPSLKATGLKQSWSVLPHSTGRRRCGIPFKIANTHAASSFVLSGLLNVLLRAGLQVTTWGAEVA